MIVLFPLVILLNKFLSHLGPMTYTETEGILKQDSYGATLADSQEHTDQTAGSKPVLICRKDGSQLHICCHRTPLSSDDMACFCPG